MGTSNGGRSSSNWAVDVLCLILIPLLTYGITSGFYFLFIHNELLGERQEVKLKFTSSKSSSPVTFLHCPEGLLFSQPVHVQVSHRAVNTLCRYEDICGAKEICDNVQEIEKVQYIPGNLITTPDLYEVIDTKQNVSFQIHTNEIKPGKSAPKEPSVLSRFKRTAGGELTVLSNNIDSPRLVEDTKQLLYFLVGLSPKDVTSDLAIARLLPHVFSIIRNRCDPRQLQPKFLDNVHLAFLWLLSHYGITSTHVSDIPMELAVSTKRALEECAQSPYTIKVHGGECEDSVTSVSMVVPDIGVEAVLEYEYNDRHAFQWGMYDPIVEAIWLSVDTVHALCSAQLEKNGVLHTFFTDMVKLLTTKRMMKRWTYPTPLLHQEVYDQALMAPVNESLRILDACNLAGTMASPFGRARRPIPKQTLPEDRLHKYNIHRRSIREESEEPGLSEIPVEVKRSSIVAHCLRSESERRVRMSSQRREQCNFS